MNGVPWSNFFMGPQRFGLNAGMPGVGMPLGYQLGAYDPRAAVMPLVSAAKSPLDPTIPHETPRPRDMTFPFRFAGAGGTGAGNPRDREGPHNVPGRPLSDLPGFLGQMFGGPLAWAGVGPFGRPGRDGHDPSGGAKGHTGERSDRGQAGGGVKGGQQMGGGKRAF